MDLSSPQAWTQAEAVAAAVTSGSLSGKSDALPFMFTSGDMTVLAHRRDVIQGRGGSVAGSYLRDLGVIQWDGPQINDVLFVRQHLEALPNVDGVDKSAFVHEPDNPKKADINPAIGYGAPSVLGVVEYWEAHVGLLNLGSFGLLEVVDISSPPAAADQC